MVDLSLKHSECSVYFGHLKAFIKLRNCRYGFAFAFDLSLFIVAEF